MLCTVIVVVKGHGVLVWWDVEVESLWDDVDLREMIVVLWWIEVDFGGHGVLLL